MKEYVVCSRYDGEGIGGFVACDAFLVSILNPLPRLCPEKTTSMHKHTQTEECFVLLQGKAMLYAADGLDAPEDIRAYPMEQGKIYRVPRGTWHSPVLSPDARILLVENRDTTEENSPRVALNEEQIARVRALGKQLW